MSNKEQAIAIVKKAQADLDSGKISRRDFSLIMMSFGALAGFTLFSSPASGWVATRIRKSTKGCRTVDKCDIFGDGSGKALYRMDGNANDESGNFHGAETAITYGGGAYERGAVFSGSADIATTHVMSGPFSISFFAKLNTLAPSGGPFVIGGYGISAGNFGIQIAQTSGTIGKFFIGAYGTATMDFNTGNFIHFVVTYDGTTVKIYKDTVLFDSITTTLTYTGTTLIGSDTTSHTRPFVGTLDQLRIFNRVVTASEISRLYAECAPTSIVNNTNPFQDGSLKAMYQLENNLSDKTNTYNTLFTGATTYTAGKFGQAGIAAGVATGTANIPFPASTGNCSISYWTNNQGTRDRAFGFFQDSSHYLGVYFGGASFLAGGTAPIALGYTIDNTATMKHFVWSFSGGQCKFYQDGILKATLTIAAGFTTINSFTDGGSTTTMLADQLRIFNKALTPMEVACLYCETTPLEEPLHSLVDPFKDGSGRALYRLDGNANDESGNYNATPTSVTYGAGKFARCGIFASASSSNIAISGTPIAATPTSFSISMWINATTLPSTMGLISNADNAAANFAWGITSTGYFQVNWNNANRLTTATSPISTGSWFHVMITYDGSNLKAYVNGTLSGSSTPTAPSGLNTSYKIGFGWSSYWNGNIDQVRIFNRALTQAEVTSLHNEV